MPENRANKILEICGGYPSKRSLFASVTKHLEGEKNYRSLPTQIKYRTTSADLCRIPVRHYDLALVNEKGHLDLILAARAEDSDAKRELQKKEYAMHKKFSEYFSVNPIRENEFIVPSSTSRTDYSANSISDKGTILLDAVRKGHPIPDFAILNGDCYKLPYDERKPIEESELYKQMKIAIKDIEILTGKNFGGPVDPLLLAVRCAMPIYVPGLMPTYLNAGLTHSEKSHSSLRKHYGRETASRIILNNLKTNLTALDPNAFSSFERDYSPNLSHAANEALSRRMIAEIGEGHPIISDPYYQVFYQLRHAYSFYHRNATLIESLMGKGKFPAIILQDMVCSAFDDSFAGVLYSRHPRMIRSMQLISVRGMYGEELMTRGKITPSITDFNNPEDIRDEYPAVSNFIPQLSALEIDHGTPVTIEMATERSVTGSTILNTFAMLQLNHSILNGFTMLHATIDLYHQEKITREKAVELIKSYHLRQLESSDIVLTKMPKGLKLFCYGTSVLPMSAVSGIASFSADQVRAVKGRGQNAILFKEIFDWDDAEIMGTVDGMGSIKPLALHAATISNERGVPTLLDLEKNGIKIITFNKKSNLIDNDGNVIREGEMVTISSYNQALLKGKAENLEGKFMQFVRGEAVEIPENEIVYYEQLKQDYQAFNKILEELPVANIRNIYELSYFISKIRDGKEKAAHVSSWYDLFEPKFLSGILNIASDDQRFAIGGGVHFIPTNVFNLLSLDRQIRAYRLALQACADKKPGYDSGHCILGSLAKGKGNDFRDAFSSDELKRIDTEIIHYENHLRNQMYQRSSTD